jgi:hypothetical protein
MLGWAAESKVELHFIDQACASSLRLRARGAR